MSVAERPGSAPSGPTCCATSIGCRIGVDKNGRQMTLRTPATGIIGPLFKAARIALPHNVREPEPA
jgi:hypothetical protein